MSIINHTETTKHVVLSLFKKGLSATERKDYMLHKVMTEKVRLMTEVQRDFALKDVRETMKLHDRDSDYYAKLEAEYDALLEAMG